jgi:hypothetical protein
MDSSHQSPLQNYIHRRQTSETDMHPTSSGMDATECHEVLQGSLAGTILILIWYRESFSQALIPQQQLWHLDWPASVQPTGRRPAFTRNTGTTLRVSWGCCSKHQNIRLSGGHELGYCNAHSLAAVPAWLLQAPGVKSMSQWDLCSSVMLCNTDWQLGTKLLGPPIGPILKIKQSQVNYSQHSSWTAWPFKISW